MTSSKASSEHAATLRKSVGKDTRVAGATAGDGERPLLDIRSVSKTYDDVTVVRDVSLSAADGEFVTLLGPSGSGKTTTLRMVAGFLAPDQGSIELSGVDITTVPSHRRGLGMVFQNYALFPHMTLFDNVAFPLRMRGHTAAEIRERVGAALEMVHLGALASRRPKELSGGQQQRVALARAIVFRPPLVLMDEPMGALDRKLREQLQTEVAALCRELSMTVLYVTHDQDEALRLSDRIAVFEAGEIIQIDAPREVYDRPTSLFVAGFLGDANVVEGRLVPDGSDGATLHASQGPLRVVGDHRDRGQATAQAVVRPEHVRVRPVVGDATEGLVGQVVETEFVGARARIVVRLPDGVLVKADQEVSSLDGLAVGTTAGVSWSPENLWVIPMPSVAVSNDDRS